VRAALALALVACGPQLTLYERTAPRHVEVTKQATPPVLEFTAHLAGDTVELAAKHASDVRITRVVDYSATAIELRRGNPLIEIIEIPIGLVFAVVGPAAWETPYRFVNTPTTKVVLHTNWVVSMINPLQTTFVYRARAIPTSDADVFADPPVVRDVHIRLPAPGVTAHVRVLDEGEHAIATADLTTDGFGRALIENAARAVALEVTVDGKPTIVPIE
jgi:hypothetical protein